MSCSMVSRLWWPCRRPSWGNVVGVVCLVARLLSRLMCNFLVALVKVEIRQRGEEGLVLLVRMGLVGFNGQRP